MNTDPLVHRYVAADRAASFGRRAFFRGRVSNLPDAVTPETFPA